jgi:hypothetical protein
MEPPPPPPQPDRIPGWKLPALGDRPQRRREPPYMRSIGWAILAWIAALGAVYFVAQVLGKPQLGGYAGFVGFLLGYWIGGVRGGISGINEWIAFTIMLTTIAVVTLGVGSCAVAIAMYG